MARRARGTTFSRSLQRTIKALTRSAVRAGTTAVTQALHPGKPARRQRPPAKTAAARPGLSVVATLPNGFMAGLAGVQRYRLFVPPGSVKTERLPLLVMLHGCTQSSEAFAASTRMNQIAAKEGFAVLYPEQNRRANLQGCWPFAIRRVFVPSRCIRASHRAWPNLWRARSRPCAGSAMRGAVAPPARLTATPRARMRPA